MDSRDLVEHSIRGYELDRVPIIPLIGVHSAYLFKSLVDLKPARNVIEDRCLLGNIDTNLLKNGSRKDIVDMVERCLKYCGDTLFILSTGCEVVRDTPPQKILYMIKAGRRLLI